MRSEDLRAVVSPIKNGTSSVPNPYSKLSPKTMASSSEFNASHIQSLLSEQTPFLNLFFPGLAPVTSSLRALLTVIPNGYSGLLCVYGLLLLFGKYAFQYVVSLLEAHFSQLTPP